uniref:LamG-like jellyroll fold domain-containing protein n=1 Tax=viral metagenome TaxID=1070528 RepID=A0A6C0LCK4_9ZZZZ
MDSTKKNNTNKTSFYISTFVMIILGIISIILLYTEGKNVGQTSSPSSSFTSGNTFLLIAGVFTLAILVFLYVKYPDFFQSVLSAFTGSYYLIFVVLYLVFFIILYQNILTPEQVNSYAYFLLPLTVVFAVILFFLSVKETVGDFLNTNRTTDRIKYSILYFCLIIFLSLLYFFDPNQYISTYLGPYLVISILLAIFGFLYLLTLMSFPNNSNNNAEFLSRFNPYTIINVCIFLLFLILLTVGLVSYPGGFLNSSDYTKSTTFVILIFIFIAWITSFILSLFPSEIAGLTGEATKSSISDYGSIFQKILLLLFGLSFSSLLIYWLVVNIQSLSTSSGIVSFLLNLFIILIILGLTFKIFSSTSFYQNSPLLRLIVNTLLYIPCIFVSIVDKLSFLFGIASKYSPKPTKDSNLPKMKITDENTASYLVYLVLLLVASGIYLIYPYIEKKVTSQGGLLLVNQPVYLNQETNLASYQTLNQTSTIDLNDENNPMQFNYHYAISMWVFFDSTNPSSLSQYMSILNYGNKPNIMFNPVDNTLIFTLQFSDNDAETQVVYTFKDVLLQKWNHILVNYSGNIFDIFINGELKKSVVKTIPYQKLDVLQIGSNNGIQGGICNVNYFNKSIHANQVKNLYQFFKDKTPPTHSSSPDTIINILEQVPNIVNNKPIEISKNETYLNSLENAMTDISKNKEDIKNEISIDKIYYNKNNYISWDWYFKNNNYE